jgi:hypothetical protein
MAAPALLVPVAAGWVLAARGPDPGPLVAVITVAVAAAMLLVRPRPHIGLFGPAVWLAGLLAWAAADAVMRRTAVWDAAHDIAAGVLALALLAACATPRVAAWGRMAVIGAGGFAAVWMVIERGLRTERPGGPFGNPNGGATVALLGLALVPFVRAPRWARAALLVVTAAGVVASGSRAALLGAGAMALVWGFVRRGTRTAALTAATVAALALGGLAIRVALDRDPLRFERLRIWGVALRVAGDQFPLGAGPGGYADAAVGQNFPREGEFARFARLPDLAESDILAAGATLGAPGLGILAGLVASLVAGVRGRGAMGWGVVVAIGTTSAFNSQLMVPALAWTSAVAVGSVLARPPRGRRLRLRAPHVVAVATAAVAVAAVLAAPDWGIGRSPQRLAEQAEAALRRKPWMDSALADGEAAAWSACTARPRFGRAWRALGNLRLARAAIRDDPALVSAAADAFAHARDVNSLDAWAALGEGRARRILGEGPAAQRALAAAVGLEPNCAPAWLEQALLHEADGAIQVARDDLAHAEAAFERARGATFVSDYERALATADPATVARLRASLRGAP